MDLALEFTLQIARQALEQTLLSELEEKDGTLFTGADATLEFCALGEKEEFYSFLPKATNFSEIISPKRKTGEAMLFIGFEEIFFDRVQARFPARSGNNEVKARS